MEMEMSSKFAAVTGHCVERCGWQHATVPPLRSRRTRYARRKKPGRCGGYGSAAL